MKLRQSSLMHMMGGVSRRDSIVPGLITHRDYENGHNLIFDLPEIVLTGGGIDSFIAHNVFGRVKKHYEGDIPKASKTEPATTLLHFDYGQPNAEAEKRAVKEQARKTGRTAATVVLEDPFYNQAVPVARKSPVKKLAEITPTAPYVPLRNSRFLLDAAAYAEMNLGNRGCVVVVGACGSGHLDNSARVLQNVVNLVHSMNPEVPFFIYAPFAQMTKSAVITVAETIGIRYPHRCSTSCFVSNEYDSTKGFIQCGRCKSCLSLKEAYRFAGISNPFTFSDEEVPEEKRIDLVDDTFDGINEKPRNETTEPVRKKKGFKKKSTKVEEDYEEYDDDDDLEEDED